MLRSVFLCVLVSVLSHGVLAQDAATNSTWESYGGVPGGGRFSALTQINGDTVSRLKVAWVHESGDVATAPDAPTGQTSYEVTPLHANGLLYYCIVSSWLPQGR